MLKKRIIPVTLFSNGWLVQTKNFSNFRNLGNPYEIIKRLSKFGSDELIYVDISRGPSLNLRQDVKGVSSFEFIDTVKKVSEISSIPLTCGGKVKTMKEINNLLINGADKVLINTEFHNNSKLISTSSKEFGSQAIVGGIDVKRHDNEYFVYHSNGLINSKIKVLDWAKFLEDNGCGEIFVNSIDKDGSNLGFDLELGKKLIDSINLPLIFCGGASDEKHFMELFNLGFDAAAAANMFNYKEQSIYNVKKNLYNKNYNVRKPFFL